jgi:putative flippase GtrA
VPDDDKPRQPSSDADPDGPERDETATERADRNWDELLQELRVTQTGIQILSGFLLTLPFQQRFTALDPPLRTLFLIAVAMAALSTGLVVAPVAAHRLLFRKRQKIALVDTADRLAKVGLACVGLTIVVVLALVFGFVLGDTAAFVAGGAGLVVFTLLWLVLPLLVLRRAGGRSDR